MKGKLIAVLAAAGVAAGLSIYFMKKRNKKSRYTPPVKSVHSHHLTNVFAKAKHTVV